MHLGDVSVRTNPYAAVEVGTGYHPRERTPAYTTPHGLHQRFAKSHGRGPCGYRRLTVDRVRPDTDGLVGTGPHEELDALGAREGDPLIAASNEGVLAYESTACRPGPLSPHCSGCRCPLPSRVRPCLQLRDASGQPERESRTGTIRLGRRVLRGGGQNRPAFGSHTKQRGPRNGYLPGPGILEGTEEWYVGGENTRRRHELRLPFRGRRAYLVYASEKRQGLE